MRCAVVETATNIVINIIMADPETDPPPIGTFLVGVGDEYLDIGWIYDPATGTFSAPPEGNV